MLGGRSTRKGRVVYNRQVHGFTGHDMLRVMIAVNNNDTGNFVNWNAAFQIAYRNYLSKRPIEGVVISNEKLTALLDVNDWLIETIVPILKIVPGTGPILEIISGIYKYVTDYANRSEIPAPGVGD
jgi:hypothetical protein